MLVPAERGAQGTPDERPRMCRREKPLLHPAVARQRIFDTFDRQMAERGPETVTIKWVRVRLRAYWDQRSVPCA